MQRLVFNSLNSLVDIDELQRRAFNCAFEKSQLNWLWSRVIFHQLLPIRGERHRVVWYAEHVLNRSISCGLADKICWWKDSFLHEFLTQEYCSLRPGVARLLCEAKEANAVAEIHCTPEDPMVLLKAVRHGNATLDLPANGSKPKTTLAVTSIEPRNKSRPKRINDSTACIINPYKPLTPKQTNARGYSVNETTVITCGSRPDEQTLVNHLGDPNNPATHLSGKDILLDGIVSVASLSALEA